MGAVGERWTRLGIVKEIRVVAAHRPRMRVVDQLAVGKYKGLYWQPENHANRAYHALRSCITMLWSDPLILVEPLPAA